jgi:serpin B
LIYLVLRLTKNVSARLRFSHGQRLAIWCGLGLLAAIGMATSIVAHRPASPVPFSASPEVISTVNANTAFALDLYQSLQSQPDNLFFSPYSISTTLAMAYAGARGDTEKEMARTLNFSPAETNLSATFGTLAARLHQIQRWHRITLTTASSLWGQRDYPFTETYLNLIRKEFRGEIRTVDFSHARAAACGQINSPMTRGWFCATRFISRANGSISLVLRRPNRASL